MTANNYFTDVLAILRLEAQAIGQTADRLEESQVAHVVDLLAKCKGKIVVVGVGKSGIIAQKIAATMTSTGSAALHLHPSDALHGGIGIINAEDVVMILSNSGETDEILGLMPALKRRGVPIIALLGNLQSSLARQADAVIDASVDQEAGPLNLAPTTSTTVALALGDALAMTLMQVKGLTSDDFAINHPAGQLGKRLTVTVSDLMHGGEANPTIQANAAWMDIVRAITNGGLGAVNVVDENGELLGIITDGDLRRAIQQSDVALLADLKCEQIMTRNPTVAKAELLAYEALRLMEDRPSQISVLPVVNGDGSCVGLIRLHDIVRSGL
jgi:arabinose-5-phosphate isomerase